MDEILTRAKEQLVGRTLYRSVIIERGAVDREKRTVAMVFSTESPVERFFGFEVLDHSPASVIMDRLKNRAPFLDMHDPYNQVGVIEEATIDTDRKGRAVARLSRNPDGEALLVDIEDSIKTKVSVGYIIHDMVLESEVEGVRTYRITKWEPIEVSSVSIEADTATGVGRFADDLLTEQAQRSLEQALAKHRVAITLQPPASERVGPTGTSPTTSTRGGSIMEPTTPTPTREEVLREERSRATEIEAIARKFVGRIKNITELRDTAVTGGQSVADFRGMIVTALADSPEPAFKPDSDLDLTGRDKKRYSLLRVIQSRLNPKIEASFERECSTEIATRLGRDAKGDYIPWDIQQRDLSLRIQSEAELNQLRTMALEAGLNHAARALTTTTTGGAKELVGTDLRADMMIDMLRNKSVAGLVGVSILYGLQGNIAFPKQTAAGTWEWTLEAGTTTGSALTTAQITMSPKEGRAFQEYTRLLLLQSTPSVEFLVQNDLFAIARLGIDKAWLHGVGTTQPRGIANESGVGSVSGVNIGWAGIVDFETKVAVGNAEAASMFYLMNPATRGILKTRVKAINTATYLMDERGMVNGYGSIVSNQINTGCIFFGSGPSEVLGYWGNLDILVNPYAKDKEGITRVNIYADVDSALRQAAAWSYSGDVS